MPRRDQAAVRRERRGRRHGAERRDARAYCEWAGKRLCKALDGSALGFDDDPVLGEWHFACSGGLMTTYPYGDEPDDSACHIDGDNSKEPVGSFPACEGGYPGLFDMQGNVHEWVDACESHAPTALCRVRGGGTYGAAVQRSCARTGCPRRCRKTRALITERGRATSARSARWRPG